MLRISVYVYNVWCYAYTFVSSLLRCPTMHPDGRVVSDYCKTSLNPRSRTRRTQTNWNELPATGGTTAASDWFWTNQFFFGSTTKTIRGRATSTKNVSSIHHLPNSGAYFWIFTETDTHFLTAITWPR